MYSNIPGFPSYKITPNGEIFSLIQNRPLTPKFKSMGYPYVTLKVDGKRISCGIHRLLALAFLPNPLDLPEVNHIDGNKANNQLSNLEWVSGADNIRHAFKIGLASKNAAIDYKDIPLIIEQLTHGKETWTTLTKKYKLSDASIIRKLVKRDMERQGKHVEFNELCLKCNSTGLLKRSTQVKATFLDNSIKYFSSFQEAGRFLNKSGASVFKACARGTVYANAYWERVNA